MVSYRRRRFRRTRRSRRPYRRAYRRPRYSRRSTRKGKNTLLLKRTLAQYFSVTDLPQYNAVGWRLQDIPNYGEITALFDQYKICMVKQKWTFSNAPQAQQLPFTTGAMSTFHYAFDVNDNSIPTSLAQLEEYQTYKNRVLAAEKPFTLTFRPMWAAMAYEGGAGTGYSAKRGWIDCNDPGVYHYGIKWSIQPALEGVTGNVSGRAFCYTTYYIACKNTK